MIKNTKYASEEARKGLARALAVESMVLLKNEDQLLPLKAEQQIALVGRTQLSVHIGGSGSGASRTNTKLELWDELAKAGILLEPAMYKFYKALQDQEAAEAAANPEEGFDFSKLEGLVSSGLIYEIFGRYTAAVPEPVPTDEVFAASAKAADTAMVILGRVTGGEECDRRVEDDYYLLDSEKELIRKACAAYPNVIVVYNVNGMVDMAFAESFPQVKAVLFMGTAGEQAAGALVDIITGKESPSGKMIETAACSYEDYPTAKNFSSNKDKPETILTYKDYGLSAEDNGSVGFDMSPVTVYEEDIYVGYRYFETFEKQVLYPFGFGLSYASFSIVPLKTELKDGRFKVRVRVSNTSTQFGGKEVVQLYVHAPFGRLKKPYIELKAFTKTEKLGRGGNCLAELSFDLKDLASFDEAQNAFVIEKGTYAVLVGNSAVSLQPVGAITVEEDIITRKVTADIGFTAANRGKIHLMEPECERPVDVEGLPVYPLMQQDIEVLWPAYTPYDFSVDAVPSTLADVRDGKVSMEQFIKQMSLKELAVLCNGYGPGLPFSGIGAKDAKPTIQDDDGNDIATKTRDDVNMGYCNPAIEKYGIVTTFYKDGPASNGITAWPTGRMIASTFNADLAYEFGSAAGAEADLQDVDSWLAPAMNMIRNPIGGRGFEYFSEDPLVTGIMGTQITKGCMENNDVTTCPKHFALNEQETYRRGKANKNIDAADSIVSARAARELYLKPFEMAITEAKPTTIMSSFNKINGTFAGGSRVLCTEILRGEWGYDGVVVTDWGDMDIVVDGGDAVHAGNDVIMPGGPPVIAQVLKGYEEGRVTLDEMREAVAHLMNYVMNTKPYKTK
ncbi:MAG: glycoside hydrolase family 3 C-terminal domain-containing protein [Firmicutes bacterium]|nr:glycoside hydrolase family 3 C-terminal domain-containing protein [Bacillota bacterium]